MRQEKGFTFRGTVCAHAPPLVRHVNDLRGETDPDSPPVAPCGCGRPRLVIEVVYEPHADLSSVSLALVMEEGPSAGHGLSDPPMSGPSGKNLPSLRSPASPNGAGPAPDQVRRVRAAGSDDKHRSLRRD